MTWLIILLVGSILSSILVLAAGMLSSRMNRHEDLVEVYEEFAQEAPSDTVSQPQIAD